MKHRARKRRIRTWFGKIAPLAARVLAFWFGAFTLVNVAGALRHPTFDENIWWVDLRFLPGKSGQILLAAAGILLVAHAVHPPKRRPFRIAAPFALTLLGIAAIANTIGYYREWAKGDIHPMMPFPFSLVIAALLGLIAYGLTRKPPAALGRAGRLTVIAAATACFVAGVPLGQALFFGTTDYRRPADAIVVFGAKVNPDGVPSFSLRDRLTTAVQLYQQGLADTIIVSGGIEPTGLDEAQVMRDYAVSHGVPAAAIIMDPNGVNTDATVADTTQIFREHDFQKILAVSHFYHLPRVKLSYQRAGYDVYTVPSHLTFIHQLPIMVAREIPAFWVYYLRAVIG